MENENDYLVKNPKIILERLTAIFKSKCIISAHFGEQNNAFITAITAIDAKKNILKIDCAPTEILNKQLLNSSKVLFRTQIDGIKVSFSGKSIKKCLVNNQPNFEMPIPNALFWMQRRHFYRIKVPLSHAQSFCEILIPGDASEQPGLFKESQRYRIADISIRGFAFFNPVLADSPIAFNRGMILEHSTLHLNDGSKASIGFRIKDITTIKSSLTSSEQRIGCEFIDLTSTFETSLQRYIQAIEIQMKNIAP